MKRYLPDRHDFPYWARAPWPYWGGVSPQQSMQILELWLNCHVGSHYQLWAWHDHDHEYWEACVAFRRGRDQTLFLLQWA